MSIGKERAELDLDLSLEGVAMRGDVLEMEGLIKTIGKHITETKENLSNDWQEFAQETRTTLQTELTSVKGITQFFQEKMRLVKHNCTMEPTKLNVFLNNVVQALERNAGHEEQIFNQLINFCAEHNLILPTLQPESNVDITQSTASLNVVFSQHEENTTALWAKICRMISNELLFSIEKLSLVPNYAERKTELLTKKLGLLEKLCVLFPLSDVWRKYLEMRKMFIRRVFNNSLLLDDVECLKEECFPTMTDGCDSEDVVRLLKVARVLVLVLEEDYDILTVGMFPDAMQMQPDEIFTVYLSLFGDELHKVVKSLHSLSRRSSVEQQSDVAPGSILPPEVFSSLRSCVLAATTVDQAARKLITSLNFCLNKPNMLGQMDSRFGSTISISSPPSTPNEANSYNKDPSLDKVIRDQPDSISGDSDVWFWQDEFKPSVSKLALVIVENMQAVLKCTLDQEIDDYKTCKRIGAAEVTGDPFGDSLRCPRQITRSCAAITEKTKELLVFLSLGPGKEFDAIRTSFSESLTTTLMAYEARLFQLSADVPQNAPITNLYLVFNSAIFLKNTLKLYEEGHQYITGSLSSLYSDLVDSLHQKIISYHYATISTVILQDVESHHWINQKDFFEGERCSFSVQMWNYYMQGFRHDLWNMCPAEQAQTIFTRILQYSLSCFVRRYSKAMPSYKRTKLLRMDITSILLTVSSWLIFTISTSSTDLFNPNPTKDAVNDIHNSCSTLLGIMTILCCPLETLCLFTSGGAEELINDGLGTSTSWLTWLQPEVYGEQCKSLASLTDVQAVNIYFKLMINQPAPSWGLVLQTLLLRNAYLAVTIVTYLESHFIHLHNEVCETLQTSKKAHVRFENKCVVDQDPEQHCHGIVGSLYYVIFHCCHGSKPLVNFIIALMNRENSWQIFTSAEGLRLGDEDNVPAWLDCLYSTMKPFICRLTQTALSELRQSNQTTTKSFKFTAINSLPCGCEVSKDSTSAEKQKDKTELLMAAFEHILKSLISCLPSTPRILFKIFNGIEGGLQKLKLTSNEESSAGLKILGSMLFRCLSTDNLEDSLNVLKDDTNFVQASKQLAQLVYHVLVGDLAGYCERASLPMAFETAILNRKSWILEQVKKLDDVISEMNESQPTSESEQDHFLELECDIRARDFQLDPKGNKALEQIYRFCREKKDWIIRRVPIASHLGSPHQIPPGSSRDTFNPVEAHQSLGEYHFNHSAIEGFPYDWEQMFQSNIGMNVKSIKRLVYNRYELQHEKYVDDDKLELLEKLKAFYDMENDVV